MEAKCCLLAYRIDAKIQPLQIIVPTNNILVVAACREMTLSPLTSECKWSLMHFYEFYYLPAKLLLLRVSVLRKASLRDSMHMKQALFPLQDVQSYLSDSRS